MNECTVQIQRSCLQKERDPQSSLRNMTMGSDRMHAPSSAAHTRTKGAAPAEAQQFLASS